MAKSFARIFYRNCVNLGILVLESQHTDRIDTADEILIDYATGRINNRTKNETYACGSIPQHVKMIVDMGGLLPYLKHIVSERRIGNQA